VSASIWTLSLRASAADRPNRCSFPYSHSHPALGRHRASALPHSASPRPLPHRATILHARHAFPLPHCTPLPAIPRLAPIHRHAPIHLTIAAMAGTTLAPPRRHHKEVVVGPDFVSRARPKTPRQEGRPAQLGCLLWTFPRPKLASYRSPPPRRPGSSPMSFKCSRCFRLMFQVFHLNISSVFYNVIV
jgi:hypothetical protein